MFDLKLFFYERFIIVGQFELFRNPQFIFILSQVQYLFDEPRDPNKRTQIKRMSSAVNCERIHRLVNDALNRNLCKLEVYFALMTALNQINDTGHLITKRRVVGATYHLSSPFLCALDSPLI